MVTWVSSKGNENTDTALVSQSPMDVDDLGLQMTGLMGVAGIPLT